LQGSGSYCRGPAPKISDVGGMLSFQAEKLCTFEI
jgi:hypothetical protein